MIIPIAIQEYELSMLLKEIAILEAELHPQTSWQTIKNDADFWPSVRIVSGCILFALCIFLGLVSQS